MTELKTLKDMSFYDDGDLQRPDIRKNYLRQEAIKWIKELNLEIVTVSNGLAITEQGYESYDIRNTNKSALILWITHFFNITKEKLND